MGLCETPNFSIFTFEIVSRLRALQQSRQIARPYLFECMSTYISHFGDRTLQTGDLIFLFSCQLAPWQKGQAVYSQGIMNWCIYPACLYLGGLFQNRNSWNKPKYCANWPVSYWYVIGLHEQQYPISKLPFSFVSKWVQVWSLSYENEFYSHAPFG